VRAAAAGAPAGTAIRARHDLERWLADNASEREGGLVPATFIVSLAGDLHIASRRSEHVACAAGQPVLSAGELFFEHRPAARVAAASNLSTGYCPEPASWPSLAAALHRAQPGQGRPLRLRHLRRGSAAPVELRLSRDGGQARRPGAAV
jgi:hypothetical protein